MRILSVLALLLSTVSVPAQAADKRPARPDWRVKLPAFDMQTTNMVFPTGLRIVAQSDRSHKTVSAFMLVDHGRADDPVGFEETAHFVEHVWFRSKQGELPPIMSVLGDLGVAFNATTRFDWTDYRTTVSSEFLPTLLRLESKRLTNFYGGVTEEEIDIEREVIRSEWRRRNEQNVNLFFDYMFNVIYPEDHPYHRHSTHESMDAINLKVLQEYADKYYRPDTTTLYIAGDFDPDEILSLIYENFDLELLHPDLTGDMLYFSPKPGIDNPDQNNPDHWLTGAWEPETFGTPDQRPLQLVDPRTVPPRVGNDRPPVPEVGTTEIQERSIPVIDNRLVLVGWSLPGGYRDDHWNLQLVGGLANAVVSQSFSAEIAQERIVSAGCGSFPQKLNTTAFCIVEIDDDKIRPLDVRARILDQLAQIWNPENYSGDHLGAKLFRINIQRGKLQSIAQQLHALDLLAEVFGSRAESLVPYVHYTGKSTPFSDGVDQIQNIDLGTAAELAETYLKRDRAATMILTPLDRDEIDIASEESEYDGASEFAFLVNPSDDLAEIDDQQIADSYIQPNIDGALDFTLDNGLRAVIVPHGNVPTAEVRVVFRRNAFDEPRVLGDAVALFTRAECPDMLAIAGSPRWLCSPGIPGAPVGIAAPVSAPLLGTMGSNGFSLSVRVPSGNVDGGLWMLRDTVETMRTDFDGRQRTISNIEDNIYENWASSGYHLFEAMQRHLYPDDRYAILDWGDLQAMRDAGGPELRAWRNQHIRPENATLVVVGPVDPDEVKRLAEVHLGGWNAPDSSAPLPAAMKAPPMPTENDTTIIVHDPERTQTQLTAACRLNFAGPEDREAVDVLSSLVFNRVFTQLRVNEGLAYSPVGFSRWSPDDSATLQFRSLAINTGVGRTVEYFQEVLQKIEGGDIDPAELKLHKLRQAREAGIRAQSSAQLARRVANTVLLGEPLDSLDKVGERIASVNADQLVRLAQGCSDHIVTLALGPEQIIAPQLEERGFEYEHFTTAGKRMSLLWEHAPAEAKKAEKERQKAARERAKDEEQADKKKEDEEGEDAVVSAAP